MQRGIACIKATRMREPLYAMRRRAGGSYPTSAVIHGPSSDHGRLGSPQSPTLLVVAGMPPSTLGMTPARKKKTWRRTKKSFPCEIEGLEGMGGPSISRESEQERLVGTTTQHEPCFRPTSRCFSNGNACLAVQTFLAEGIVRQHPMYPRS